MSSNMSLKEAERKAFRSTFQDGLWDVYLGFVFLLFGIGPLIQVSADNDWILSLGYFVPLVLLFVAAKKYITTPRIGRAKFSQARKRKVKKVRLLLLFSVVLGTIIYLMGATGDGFAGSFAKLPIVLLVFTVNVLLIFWLGAYFLDFSRLYVYGALLGLSFPAGFFLMERGIVADETRPFILTSSIMIVVGIVLFVRFLRENPPIDENSLSEGGA
ncbi:MAG: hypothetical protein DWQ04_17845 [Chloroflexi bacterium]|nr:MAG: hypothetical protein DWQ04_17845 [Chloroflexota bacterium]